MSPGFLRFALLVRRDFKRCPYVGLNARWRNYYLARKGTR